MAILGIMRENFRKLLNFLRDFYMISSKIFHSLAFRLRLHAQHRANIHHRLVELGGAFGFTLCEECGATASVPIAFGLSLDDYYTDANGGNEAYAQTGSSGEVTFTGRSGPQTITLTPAPASATAIARPIPLVAPVTRAVFPDSSLLLIFCCPRSLNDLSV